ncbi:MAG: Gfo/Idh/MocA family oxidoreductase [Oscillospiraceae bacterium]|nr:Gfo/Idh/MocA family oxidoreductase [Oscillospiraceae bacterium]
MSGGGNGRDIRFGIVGCGMISRFHAEAIRRTPGAAISGCYDAYRPGADAFGEALGVPVFPSLEAIASDGAIDALSICTPSGLHTPQAIAAIQSGKHVVVEKPMSLTLAEADTLIAAADECGAKVCVISQFRFSPAVQEVRRAIQAGAFGTLAMAELSMKYYRSHEYYAQADWRGTWKMDGGGALMNQGIHGVDVFRFLLGPVKSISAVTRTLTRKIETEDSVVAALELESGALATISASTSSFPGYPRRLEICGDRGSVVLEEDSIIKWDLPFECPLPVGERASQVASSDPTAISVEGHQMQYANMVDALRNRAPLLVDAKQGRQPLEIILGIYESSKTGKTVRL